jgi:Holliday junction resolvase
MVRLKNPKDKGSAFERDLAKLLNEKVEQGAFEKIPGSGAIGTLMHEGLLTADLRGKVTGIPKPLKIECKVGYGGETQLTLKREWLNKVIMEAEQTYSLPMLFGKFSGARKTDGVQVFCVMDIDTVAYLFNLISKLQSYAEEDDGKS